MISVLLDRCRFPPAGTPVTCAVSGGADSLALLVLATEAGCEVTAVHVDHGLRPASQAEADIVDAAAKRFGAAFRSEQIAVPAGSNLEARARDARYAVLPPDVSTGHTADDQAETILLNLLRGAGLDGLAGMVPGRRHPILALRRHETQALCDELGLRPVVDPSNAEETFRRNIVRHRLVPILDEIAGRDVAALVARQAEHVRDDVALLDALSEHIDPTDARALAAAPVPLGRRAIRRWLRPSLGGHPPSAAAVERVLAVARQEATGCEVGRGVRIQRSRGRMGIIGS